MSDTGGGHLSSALALKAGLTQRAGREVQVDIIDLLRDHLASPFRYLPAAYPFLANRTPRLWRLLWHALEQEATALFLIRRIVPLVTGQVTRTLTRYRPDLILSVHPMVQHITVQALAEAGMHASFCTVVTDLITAHRAWFHRAAARCFVASDAAHTRALTWGLHPDQLRITGVPVRPEFLAAPAPRAVLRRDLGVDTDARLVLVLGGGDGIGNVAAVTHRLAETLASCRPALEAEIAVVCGRNRALVQRLEQRSWPLPVHVRGYVDNMHKWMYACDCIVTKAGPGTIAEALVCGRPLVLTGYIPGQETGNVAYVETSGTGAYLPDPAVCADTVASWFRPGDRTLEEMAVRAHATAQPHATDAIVSEVLALL